MRRQEAREFFMQMLFQMESQQDYSQEMKERFFTYNEIDDSQKKYLDRLFAIVTEHLNEIDNILEESSSNWKMDRIGKTDLAILRLSLAEILYFKEIPDSASINEAVELAKRYGTEDSGKFVNGILGKVVRGKNAEGKG